MRFDKSKIRNILIVSLSNIGDIILTFPAIDIVFRDFPDAAVSLVVGPRGQTLVLANPRFKKIWVYDKQQSWMKKINWIRDLRREHFDLVIDFRHTVIPVLVGARYHTPMFRRSWDWPHAKNKHLDLLRGLCDIENPETVIRSIAFNSSLQRSVDQIAEARGLSGRFVLICPGAADHRKRWPAEYFAQVADHLAEQYHLQIAISGSGHDSDIVVACINAMRHEAVTFAGDLNLLQFAALMNKADLVIGNDSGPMHLASYLDRPCVVIFGPTDPQKYGPWGTRGQYVGDASACRPDRSVPNIAVDEVIARIESKNMLIN